MKRTELAVAVCLLLTISGCCGHRKTHHRHHADTRARKLGFEAHVTGIWAHEEDKKIGSFCDFSLVRLDDQPLAVPIHLGELIETKSAVRIKARRCACERSEDVTLVLGVSLNPGKVASGTYREVDGVLHLMSGWVFIWGEYPSAATAWVAPAAIGTTIATEIKAEVHRVYFVKADGAEKVELTIAATGVVVMMDEESHYVDVRSDGSYEGPKPIADNPEAQKFIEKASELAREAGWPG
jgi:hypothetical protein